MLTNKRFTIGANTVVDGTPIAQYTAVLNVETGELDMAARYLDKAACKTHKNIVQTDRAEFEDFAYEIQDMYQSKEVFI